LILLPGMGADARLFAPQREVFPSLRVPDWIPARRGESLADYARRWAGTVTCNPPFFLGGVSFGGMVALEAARYLKPTGVFLIASCRSGRAVARRVLALQRAGRVLPTWLVARLRSPVAGYIARVEKLGAAHRRLLRELATDAPVPFLRWAVSAIRRWSWEGASGGIGIPIHQIHGRADRIIPFVPGEIDHVIQDGGHLINLTHADDVNQFILARLRPG
jgi:pimeloyl-ACP methyl ester carboxylesterase